MKCRFCKTGLVAGEQRRFETLCDHVSDPNATSHPLRETYVCPSKDCLANQVNGFWDWYGEFYYAGWQNAQLRAYEGTSAIDSHAMKCEIEIYKHDEDFTIWKGWKWQLRIKFNYVANEAGDILRKIPTLQILMRDFHSIKDMFRLWDLERSWIHISTNGSMLRFCKRRYNTLIEGINNTSSDESGNRLLSLGERLQKEWDRKDDYKRYGFNKLSQIIYGHYDWYRPVYSAWVEKRIIKDAKLLQTIIKERIDENIRKGN